MVMESQGRIRGSQNISGIQLFGSPMIPNWFEETLFINICTTSDVWWANALSLAATVKTEASKLCLFE